MTKRAVTYARVSSDDRGKGGLNLTGQLETCRAHALKKGYSIVAELAEDDRGVSGALLESPALSQALAMAAKHEFDVLIIREIDRFARSLAKQLIVEQEFKKHGIELEFVLESYDNSPEGSFHKNVKAVIAEFERVKINERTRRGRLQKVKSGNVLVHGKPPYGYRLQEQNGKSQLILHEPEARIVRMVFNWYVNGDDDQRPLSTRAIVQRLCDMAVPVPSVSRRAGNIWSRATIQHILRNETYAGVWYYGKFANRDRGRISHPEHKWLPISVPVIVAREIWKRAQMKRVENRDHSPRNTRNPYLLRGRATCATCGNKMAARSTGPSMNQRLYYYCPVARETTVKSKRCSNTTYFRADYTDTTIWTWLSNYLANKTIVQNSLEQFIDQNQKAISPIQERIEVVKNLLDHHQSQLKKIADLYIDGAFTRERLQERKKRIESQMFVLADEFAHLTERLEAWSYFPEQTDLLKRFVQEISERLDEADRDFDHQRKIIDFLNVTVALSARQGKPTAKMIFALGEIILTIEPPTKGSTK